MSRGTIKWLNAEKGFSFIAQDGGGQDVRITPTSMSPASGVN
jgi:cold shock CspA family protein